MNNCEYIDQKNVKLQKCNFTSRYGNYCYKHRYFHLLNENKVINEDNFTFQKKDYNLIDIIIYCENKNINISSSKNEKKDFYFMKISEYIRYSQNYTNDLDLIIKIQRNFKRSLDNIHKKCHNEEDFYTFDKLSDIESKYFYSYRDKKFLWGFDIRSLIKLISFNQDNPYTTERIPDNIKTDIKNRFEILKKRYDYENIQEIDFINRKDSIKQKTVDLFGDIELNGYSCQIDWFLNLNNHKLKELFRQLEDIWNYRLRYNSEIKLKLIPPDGKLFTTPISDLLNYTNKEELQELVLNDVCKFLNVEDLNDRKIGYMYFLLGLSMVSIECSVTHEWISYAIM